METENSLGHLFKQGAEAKLYHGTICGRECVVKERFSKGYRHPTLDTSIRAKRTLQEARAIAKCREAGIPSPCIYSLDKENGLLYLELIDGQTLKDHLLSTSLSPADKAVVAKAVGKMLGVMHKQQIIHGDLTTSNIMRRPNGDLVMIDFGLSTVSTLGEDKAVDLYVMERALISTHPDSEQLFADMLEAYASNGGKSAKAVLAKLDDVRARGRKKTMLG
eukprot:TRINITY_DN11718_c0_g1_i2.p2 TRINITY_DN11718_c0_g1~~TRINITY_DN11718_c0_g1_i2.p2  ORF type:complete len:220 (+),score=36.08 TRINITY_DN11718_c0_g1_i2:142-801(+)